MHPSAPPAARPLRFLPLAVFLPADTLCSPWPPGPCEAVTGGRRRGVAGYAKEKREDPSTGAWGGSLRRTLWWEPRVLRTGLSSILLPGSGRGSEPEEAGAGDVLQTERGDGVPKPHHPKQDQVLPPQRRGRALTAPGLWLAGLRGPFSVNKHSGPPSLLLHASANPALARATPVFLTSRAHCARRSSVMCHLILTCSLNPRPLQAVRVPGGTGALGPRGSSHLPKHQLCCLRVLSAATEVTMGSSVL